MSVDAGLLVDTATDSDIVTDLVNVKHVTDGRMLHGTTFLGPVWCIQSIVLQIQLNVF